MLPLMQNVRPEDDTIRFQRPPVNGDKTGIHACFEAIHHMSACVTNPVVADYFSFLVEWKIMKMMFHDLTISPGSSFFSSLYFSYFFFLLLIPIFLPFLLYLYLSIYTDDRLTHSDVEVVRVAYQRIATAASLMGNSLLSSPQLQQVLFLFLFSFPSLSHPFHNRSKLIWIISKSLFTICFILVKTMPLSRFFFLIFFFCLLSPLFFCSPTQPTSTTRPPTSTNQPPHHHNQKTQKTQKKRHELITGLPPILNLPAKIPFTPFKRFDCFKREGDLDKYAGKPKLPPIFRPIQFTLIPSRVFFFFLFSFFFFLFLK